MPNLHAQMLFRVAKWSAAYQLGVERHRLDGLIGLTVWLHNTVFSQLKAHILQTLLPLSYSLSYWKKYNRKASGQ